jgi:threonine/homoserine/homoserine lactone efflux protein
MSRIAYLAIKYLGASYLIYLGIKTLIAKHSALGTTELQDTAKGAFHQGVLTNVFNPKAIITFMAFLPQFVDNHIQHPVQQFLILGGMLAAIGALWFGFVGYFAGLIGTSIKQSRSFQNGIRYLSGSVLMLLGLRLALRKE